jgi:PAS domain-containing protein
MGILLHTSQELQIVRSPRSNQYFLTFHRSTGFRGKLVQQRKVVELSSFKTVPNQGADHLLGHSDEVFRLLVESAKDYAIFLLDPNGRVATWNQGAERIKGYKANGPSGNSKSPRKRDGLRMKACA